jgi:hypothetical protein
MKSQSRAWLFALQFRPQADKPAEYLSTKGIRDSWAVIADTDHHVLVDFGLRGDLDSRRLSGVFHRIVNEVAENHVQIDTRGEQTTWPDIQLDRLRRHSIA